MRAREFIKETKTSKIPKRYQEVSVGVNTYGDAEKWNSDYVQYRLGLALAGSDGVTPIDVAGKSWIGKLKSAHPYTQAEQDMLNQCYKLVGASAHDENNGDLKSRELEFVNKQSPVAPNPWNKKSKKVAEAATAGATSSGSIATVPNPQLSPGPARGKKSYTGSPGKSGTKAPPQPKVKQPKTKAGTAVNALDMRGNIFGAPVRR